MKGQHFWQPQSGKFLCQIPGVVIFLYDLRKDFPSIFQKNIVMEYIRDKGQHHGFDYVMP